MTSSRYFLPISHPNINFVLGGPGIFLMMIWLGSGKGTNCVQLAKEFGLIHLSTGDLLRAEASKQTSLGQEIEEMMKEGKMVPMVYFVLKWLGNHFDTLRKRHSCLVRCPWILD